MSAGIEWMNGRRAVQIRDGNARIMYVRLSIERDVCSVIGVYTRNGENWRRKNIC